MTATRMPKITISQSDAEMARLQRLSRLWGEVPSRVIARTVIHALASVEDRQGIRTVVPSEHPDQLPPAPERDEDG